MADNILRLRVDSQEYDAKLKKAAEGIRHLAEVAHRGGGELTGLEKAELDYVKALGSMETKSRTAAGSVRELENTFKELTVVYNQLNDVEKQDEGGKDLAASLDQLKQRAQAARAELDNASKALGEQKDAGQQTGGMLDGLADKFGLSITKVMGFGTALAAGKVALDVAKDAFFASESNIDEWGRTVQSADAAYNVFLQTLNTGNWSDFFKNLETAVKGARDLYDALDRLGSIKSNNQAAIAIVQQQIAQLRLAKQQGKDVDDQLKQATAQLRALQNQSINAGKTAGVKAAAETIKTRYNAQGGNLADSTVNAIVDRIMKTGQAEFDRQKKIYQELTKAGTVMRSETLTTKTGTVYQTAATPQFDINQLTDEQKKQYKLAKAITEGETQIQKGISAYAQAVTDGTSAAREEFKGNRYALQGTGGKGGKGGTTDKNLDAEQQVQKKINDLLKEALTADADRQGEIRQQVAELQKQQEKYKDIKNLAQGILPKDKEAVFTIDGQLSEETEKNLREIENVTIDDKTMTVTADTQEAMQKVQELIGQVSTTTLQMKVAPPDLDKLFHDMSKENYNTGYAGSAQAKYDSARVDLAVGPMNFDAINDYIGSIKGVLKDADLGSELYNNMTEKLKDATTVSTLLQEMMERGLEGADLESTAQTLKEKLLSPEGIDQTAIQSFLEELNKQIEEAGGVGLKMNADTGDVTDDKGKDKDDGKDLKKFNDGIGKLSGGLSQVTGGLKSIGIEIPEEVDQVIGVINGVSQIISGVGTIISVFQTSAIVANTVALGVLTSAVTANTFAKFIPFFSGGGVVPAFAQGGTIPKFADGGLIGRAALGMTIPGNSMSGDLLRMPVDGGRGFIGVNSGEVILNKAQQGVLASELEGNSRGGYDSQPYLDGELIYLGLQAYLRRSGKGEIVTANR